MGAWTEEKHAALVRLVKEGYGWADIGARLGHTANACQVRYNRHTPLSEKVYKPRPCSPELTPEQVAEARRLRSLGDRGKMDLRSMAKIMGVREIQLTRIFLPHQVESRKNRDRFRTPPRNSDRTTPIRPPQYVLDERDRAFEPMPPSRELLGDPRPGRSALDKRSAA